MRFHYWNEETMERNDRKTITVLAAYLKVPRHQASIFYALIAPFYEITRVDFGPFVVFLVYPFNFWKMSYCMREFQKHICTSCILNFANCKLPAFCLKTAHARTQLLFVPVCHIVAQILCWVTIRHTGTKYIPTNSKWRL